MRGSQDKGLSREQGDDVFSSLQRQVFDLDRLRDRDRIQLQLDGTFAIASSIAVNKMDPPNISVSATSVLGSRLALALLG